MPERAMVPVTVEQALVDGDLKGLDAEQRVNYYLKVCTSLGLNPLTKPFDYIVLNGKLVLYARKDCTDQLRKIHKVNITQLEHKQMGDLLVVTVSATTPDGRRDSATGVVACGGLRGDALANALMKAETKAKRRVTLSICGLGMTDESEVESIAGAYFPQPDEEPYVPTQVREVDDQPTIVRSADERIWRRWLELLAKAQDLGLNPKTVTLPIQRSELERRGTELVEMITEREQEMV